MSCVIYVHFSTFFHVDLMIDENELSVYKMSYYEKTKIITSTRVIRNITIAFKIFFLILYNY